jgi:hypothetical protein
MTWALELLSNLNALGAGLTNIWVADTEFYGADGDLQHPVCVVFYSPITREFVRQFFPPEPPYPRCPVDLSERSLFVAFSAQAELMTFIQLGWEMPARILDLLLSWRHINNEEFRLKTMKQQAKNNEYSTFGLLGVCSNYSIQVRSQVIKDQMINIILNGFPYTDDYQKLILMYCEDDVKDTTDLLERMFTGTPGDALSSVKFHKFVDLRSDIYHCHSARGFAWMRTVGIPVDAGLLKRLANHWERILDAIYEQAKIDFPVFNEDSYDIAPKLWEKFLEERGWLATWPKTGGGKIKKKKQAKRGVEVLEEMSDAYPELVPLHELIMMRNNTKLGLNIPVGSDGRSRVHFWDFGTVTSRCAPSSSLFILAGGSPAFRHLVKPEPGWCIIEADWSAQEVWIAAYLSGDKRMQKMLSRGDPYINFGVMANMLPADATKNPDESPYPREIALKHAVLRDRLKAVALGVLYGKTAYTIAKACGMTLDEAKALLRLHKRLFPRFWCWINYVVNEALATRKISTKFGWTRQLLGRKKREDHLNEYGKVKSLTNSLQNFPMQSHGAEMLRLAITYMSERRIGVCAPLHDAVFLTCKIEDEERTVQLMKECMIRASMNVIGAVVPVEVGITRYPDRFVPKKKPTAVKTWTRMMQLLDQFEEEEKKYV